MTGSQLRGEPGGTLHASEADTDLPGVSIQFVNAERSRSLVGALVKLHVEGFGLAGGIHHHGSRIFGAHGEAGEVVSLDDDAGAAGRDFLPVHFKRDHLPRALQLLKIGFGHSFYIFREIGWAVNRFLDAAPGTEPRGAARGPPPPFPPGP